MKRLLLALAILAAGAALFCGLRTSAARFRSEAAARYEAWLAQTQLLAQTREQHTELTTHIRELKRERLSQSSGPAAPAPADWISMGRTNDLTPEARERLLAELGFDWKSTGDFLVVSKAALRKVGVDGIRGDRLTDAACGVLAVTPEERARIESVLAGMVGEFNAWAVAHAQRAEPDGKTLAKYTLPFDAQFSQSLSNTLAAGVMSTLGAERGELLLGYASSWMLDHGVEDGPMSLTVMRPAASEDRLSFRSMTARTGLSGEVSPGRSFPEAFRAVFPGGWPDLAKREGFELPKAFQKE